MLSTTNYGLVKQELTDRPLVTQINPNWDKIDAELKKHEDGLKAFSEHEKNHLKLHVVSERTRTATEPTYNLI